MSPLDTSPQSAVDTAKEALRRHASQIDANPLTNSVFTYAHEVFRSLERGEIDIDYLGEVVQVIYSDLVEERANRFRQQHGGEGLSMVEDLKSQLNAIAEQGWETFKTALETPTGGIVFTAHPTFAMSRDARAALADHVSTPSPEARTALEAELKRDGREWSDLISLPGEHAEAQAAISCAQEAHDLYTGLVLDVAKAHFPDTWKTLQISAPTIASWVGYDLDGRTDIHWSQSFALRLQEKADQLHRYGTRMLALMDGIEAVAGSDLNHIAQRLLSAAELTEADADVFRTDLTVADNLVKAANTLTTANPARLTSSESIVAALTRILQNPALTDEQARAIIILRTQIETLRFGTARIHLRLNAAQIGTVIRRDLGLDTENRDLGRSALSDLAALAATDAPLPVNFADLMLEQSTARRQFMMCAQFLKHIDSDAPIRFLIAESENPATVMGALYLARQYGVDQSLDISPLFETPEALETGGRFIEQLLAEPEYLTYLRGRGYLSVQLGFSDAGRFIGQVSADMAIERIHNLISRAVADTGEPLSLLIFNTHGESMGRGAWPGSFKQRFDHLLSHWARQQSRDRGVPLRHEVSFQGGDGFLHFANPNLAKATYCAFASHLLSEPDAGDDPFYDRTDLVWDLYRDLRNWHERLFADEDYGHILGDFATNFLIKAGSRQRRRSSGPSGPRSLRAISHNATLQQLGIPINTAAGIGSALRREQEQVSELVQSSTRMQGLMKLASTARNITSVPVLRAYAAIYDPSFWVAMTRDADGDKALAYRRIYYLLQDRQTNTSFEKVANKLSIDLRKLDPLLARIQDAPSANERHEQRLNIHVLHAIRQALMMKALALAGELPLVSRRHEASVEDIMNLIKSMQIGDAIDVLCHIFPASQGDEGPLRDLSEPGHMAGNPANGYDQLHREIIQPLEQIDRQFHTITLAISQAYGAYG
ncbi:MAG: phosphoenolpyruvate carboxylase [Henriciella sp.]|nr:phosphoenolpyruvate carboxylase [Henriciella sp.]